jgi:solute carrier family 41
MSANYCLKAGPQLSSQWSFLGIISYPLSNLSGVGVLLQSYVDEYDALPLILPVTMSLSGNVGCIFASRLSTEFHAKTSKASELASMTSRDNMIVMATLFTISMPIFLAFLGVIYFLGIFKFSALFMITFLITGALSVLSLI